jgi:hypothetical protein
MKDMSKPSYHCPILLVNFWVEGRNARKLFNLLLLIKVLLSVLAAGVQYLVSLWALATWAGYL